MKTRILKGLVGLLFLLSANEVQAQAGQWTWIKGDSTIDVFGVYGNKGIPSSTNKPGARRLATSWTDKAGIFWLFGGQGRLTESYNSFTGLKDLWKYDANTNNWTWVNGDTIVVFGHRDAFFGVKGVPSPSNNPGPRNSAVNWVDKTGNLWLFGGDGAGPIYNDLWRYNTTTNEWTWMKGDSTSTNQYSSTAFYGIQGIASASNYPGARTNSISWTDTSGNFWLFGGYFLGSGIESFLNDLWKFNTITNKWTWIKGDTVSSINRVYGTKGVAAISNTPGGRLGSTTWRDKNNDLWLYGGHGGKNQFDYLNDLWRYNIVSNEWTWVSGDSTNQSLGSYGTQNIASPTNKPGVRQGMISWVDSRGNLFLFGGIGYSIIAGLPSGGYYNDLWKYSISTNEWTWVKGDSIPDRSGIYGDIGVSSSSNKLGSRWNGVGFKDLTGNIWVLGGQGKATQQWGYLNDLWKFTSDTTTFPVHLLTFTAQPQDKQTHLNWTVENEQNFDRYQIERSPNSKDFEKVGSVKSKAKSGKVEYEYNDLLNNEKPETRNLYYRLKMIDKDNTFSYSPIVSVKLTANNSFTISPNPAKDNIQLQFSKTYTGKSTVEIIDASGKVMLQKIVEANGSSLSASTGALPSGTYTVRLINNGEKFLQKVVVVK